MALGHRHFNAGRSGTRGQAQELGRSSIKDRPPFSFPPFPSGTLLRVSMQVRASCCGLVPLWRNISDVI